jgi:starch synthase
VTLNVLSVASEAAPLVKTGGLADVVGALPAAVAPHGVSMTTFIPGYPSVLKAIGKAREVHRWDSLLGEPARLLSSNAGGRPLLVLDAPAYFQREGGPYGDPAGHDWADNWQRFGAFGKAAAEIAVGAVKKFRFDLLHAHDWQAGLAPTYLRYVAPVGRKVPSVMTIHNMAFQGFYPASVFRNLELPKAAWSIDGVESYGGVGFLKAGLQLADLVSTVSPSYAAEIRVPEYGMGLEGLVVARGDDVVGILNGIDTNEWSPATDEALQASYSSRSVAKRIANKRVLEQDFAPRPRRRTAVHNCQPAHLAEGHGCSA